MVRNPNPSPLTRFVPGVSGNPGGRPKKLLKRLEESLHGSGVDPIREILSILADPLVGASVKLKTWVDLLPYLYPKAREAESPDDEIRMKLAAMPKEELIALMEADLLRLKNSG